jgi:lipopolysaccharide/colanic/teichoic acid biosynthesis glycosyltransferase
VASAALLVVFCPLFAIIAAAIFLDSGQPVFFRQERGGYRGGVFKIIKFRTMVELRNTNGQLLPDPERITPVGRLLRRFSLDELPELWHILKGEMSFVGPRPLLVYSSPQARRHDLRPGLTGLAQINGRNNLTWDRRFEYDIYYVEHCCASLDLKILVRTVTRVLTGHGAGHDMAGPFDGSHQQLRP